MTEKWEDCHRIARLIPLVYTKRTKRLLQKDLLVALRKALA